MFSIIELSIILSHLWLKWEFKKFNVKCKNTHIHSVLTTIFPGEPGLASCPLNSPPPLSWTVHRFGTGLNFPCHS